MCNNPNVDFVNIYEYIKLEKFGQLVLKILSGNEICRKSRAIILIQMWEKLSHRISCQY